MSEEKITSSLNKKRALVNGHKGGVMWFTGLSGSGKTTLAMNLERKLFEKGCQVFVLDGDNLRYGICQDLGFSPEDRTENIRRVIAISEILVNSGMLVLTAFISPYISDRKLAREKIGDQFCEIFLDPGLEACEARDPKGLYKKAHSGLIKDFTGVSAPYEKPISPELTLDTKALSVGNCGGELLNFALHTFFDKKRSN